MPRRFARYRTLIRRRLPVGASPVGRGPFRAPAGFPSPTVAQRESTKQFFRTYYDERVSGRNTIKLSWLGYEVWKCPLDLWTYQEIVTETRPEVIVECGTRFGGGALYLATVFDLLGGPGHIFSIDTDTSLRRPYHRRITYVAGSSTDPAILERIRSATQGRRTMVILDSDHRAEHVARELEVYPDFVSRDCYLIVDDTSIDQAPWAWEGFGPGPGIAAAAFLALDDRFMADAGRERFFLTLNPGGFLRRVS